MDKMNCSAEGEPKPSASRFDSKVLVFWRKRNGKGFASSVARYFAHVALFKPTGFQQSSQGFVFVYTTPCAHRKYTSHRTAGSKRCIHIAKAKALVLGGVVISTLNRGI